MQLKSVRLLIVPLIKGGHKWQYIDINGAESKPKLFFSGIQYLLLLISVISLFQLTQGISKEVIGYVMGAFSISVSLFMSLLVSIFDKFENTKFELIDKTQAEKERLIQKKNFFKRFISITSYLVILSILVIILCSLTYIFNLSNRSIPVQSLTFHWEKVNWILTIKNTLLILYRIVLNYFLLNYLLLTLFITSSAYEYYMSEMERRKIV